MTILKNARHLTLSRDNGASIVVVTAYIALLTVIILGSVATTRSVLTLSRRTQDTHAINEALQAALVDYLYRINNNDNYLAFAHTAAPGCPLMAQKNNSLDLTNPMMASLVPVAIPGNTSGTKVNYTINETDACANGSIYVTATAQSGNIEKTVSYVLRKRNFTDYTYFTDHESLAPSKYKDADRFGSVSVNDMCERHYYEPGKTGIPAPRPEAALGKTPGCSSINWISKDQVDGQIHSNDPFFICGRPLFTGKATTSWPGDGIRHYLVNPDSICSGSKPWFDANLTQKYCGGANDLCYEKPMIMPTTSRNLATLPETCVYYGPTRIKLLNRRWAEIISPNTPSTPRCGPGPQVNYPNVGVFYAANIPLDRQATAVRCTIPAGGTSPQNPLGYPIIGDVTSYGCHTGDIFIEGLQGGNITVASENRTIITGDLVRVYGYTIGVIGGQGIEIYHPVTSNGTNISAQPNVRNIRASLLSINDSISLQNYDKGEKLGVLSFKGSMGQKWRGLMGTADGKHGYTKEYAYEQELRFRSPPNFLSPVNSNYDVVKKTIVSTRTIAWLK